MKNLGEIEFPELYNPPGKQVAIRNSVEALHFFEEFYPKGGMVLLGLLSLESITFPNILVWLYFTIHGDEATLISLCPVFKLPADKISDLQIKKITPFFDEVYSFWRGVLYSSVYTSTGELCIKKVRMLLQSGLASRLLELQTDDVVEDIYPVELYSHSKHKFVGVCWAVCMKQYPDMVFWHPVCLDDEKVINSYPNEDLTDHFININTLAKISNKLYKLSYSDKENYFYTPIAQRKILHPVNILKMKNSFSKIKTEEDGEISHQCKIISFSPKKNGKV